MWFLQDEEVQRLDRNVITLWDVISDFGGILEVVVVLTAYMSFNIQKFLYYISIVAKIYLADDHNDDNRATTPRQSKVVPQMTTHANDHMTV